MFPSKLFGITIVVAGLLGAAEQPAPPPAEKRPVKNVYHGVEVLDPTSGWKTGTTQKSRPGANDKIATRVHFSMLYLRWAPSDAARKQSCPFVTYRLDLFAGMAASFLR
jgi:hypothetical protein